MHTYCKAFYWTLLHYIWVSEQLTNKKININQKNLPSKVLEKVGEMGKTITKPYAFHGSSISTIESVLENICIVFKE